MEKFNSLGTDDIWYYIVLLFNDYIIEHVNEIRHCEIKINLYSKNDLFVTNEATIRERR